MLVLSLAVGDITLCSGQALTFRSYTALSLYEYQDAEPQTINLGTGVQYKKFIMTLELDLGSSSKSEDFVIRDQSGSFTNPNQTKTITQSTRGIGLILGYEIDLSTKQKLAICAGLHHVRSQYTALLDERGPGLGFLIPNRLIDAGKQQQTSEVVAFRYTYAVTEHVSVLLQTKMWRKRDSGPVILGSIGFATKL